MAVKEPLTVCQLVEKLRNKKLYNTHPCFFYTNFDLINQSVVKFAKQHKHYFLNIDFK